MEIKISTNDCNRREFLTIFLREITLSVNGENYAKAQLIRDCLEGYSHWNLKVFGSDLHDQWLSGDTDEKIVKKKLVEFLEQAMEAELKKRVESAQRFTDFRNEFLKAKEKIA